MMKKILAILLAAALMLSAAALAEETALPEAEATPEVTATPIPDTLLVTVNGVEIRENDEDLQYFYENDLQTVTNPEDEVNQHYARMMAMESALQTKVIYSKRDSRFTEEEIASLKEQAKTEWDETVNELMKSQMGITDASTEEDKTAARADVLSKLESYYGYTEETYIDGAVSRAFSERVIEELKEGDPSLSATEEDVAQAIADTIAQEKEEVAAYAYYQKLAEEDPEKAAAKSYEDLYQELSEMDPEMMEQYANDLATYEMISSYYSMSGTPFHYIPEGYRGITHILLSVEQELLDKYNDLKARLEESRNGETEPAAEATEGAEATEAPAETEEPVTEEMVEAARQAILDSRKDTIDEIMKKLADGANFEDLIAEYGTDPGMQDEKNLKNGYSVCKGSISLNSEFADAAAALEKIGDVSAPVVSNFGIHILHYLRDVPAGQIEMTEEELAELKEQIESERINLAIGELVDGWVAEADIAWTAEGEAWKFDESVEEAYNAMNAAEEPAAAESTEEAPAAEDTAAETPAAEAAEEVPAP